MKRLFLCLGLAVASTVLVTSLSLKFYNKNKPKEHPNAFARQAIDHIAKELNIKERDVKTVLEKSEVECMRIFNDRSPIDEIIQYHLLWCLRFIKSSDEARMINNSKKAGEDIHWAQKNYKEFVWYLNDRKVMKNPEVAFLFEKYWEIKKRIEKSKDKDGIEPLNEKAFVELTGLEESYFSAVAISSSYGNLEETILYMKKAVETVRAAEIVGDFNRANTWQK